MVSSGNWNFKLKFQLVEEDFSQWSEALTRPGFCYLWSKLFLLCDCFVTLVPVSVVFVNFRF